MALSDSTLLHLRRDVADVFGDYIPLAFTANGTTTTLIDTVNVNVMAETYDGMELLFTSSPNDGLLARVTDTAGNTGTLTFSPARTSTVAANTADAFNKRSRGFRVAEYTRAINASIEEFNGMGLIPMIEDVSGVFDMSTGTFAVPASMREAYRVEFQDTDNIWREIPHGRPRGGYGWTAEPSEEVIRIEGNPGFMADSNSLRIHGTGLQATLSAGTDTCALNHYAVVCAASYRLCLMGMDRDPMFGQKIGVRLQEYERSKPRVSSVRHPRSVIVRL